MYVEGGSTPRLATLDKVLKWSSLSYMKIDDMGTFHAIHINMDSPMYMYIVIMH